MSAADDDMGPEQDIMEALCDVEARMSGICRVFADFRYSLRSRLTRADKDIVKLIQRLEHTRWFISAKQRDGGPQ